MFGQLIEYFKVRNNLNLSTGKLEKLQNKKLQQTITNAYNNVKYYRKLFDEAGITPADIKTVNDLNKIPITTRATFQNLSKKDFLSKKQFNKKLFEDSTSGSTGQPLIIYKTKKAININHAIKLRKYFLNNYNIFWKTGGFFQNARPAKKWFHLLGIHHEIGIRGCESLTKQIKLLQQQDIKFLRGMPSRITEVARYILEKNIKVPKKEGIICVSEVLTSKDRDIMKKAFGVEPSNSYESIEFVNIACECQKHEGLHVMMDAVVVQVKGDKQTGEAIITDLTNEAMPLIRYELGDIITLQNEPCSCKRMTQMIKRVQGRTNSYFALPSGKKISGENAGAGALSGCIEIEQYQIHQEKDKSLTIHYIPKKNKTVPENEIRKAISCNYENIKVQFKKVRQLTKLPSGKRQMFVSHLK